MIKAVLYDMDGTVLDTMPVYEAGWAYADENLNMRGRALALISEVSGMNATDCRALTLSRLGADFPYDLFRRLIREKMDEIIATQGIRCKAGAPEIFDRIRAMGIKQILVTSSAPKHVFPYLALAGIEDAFDAVITGDMVTHSKPNPEIFLLGAQRAGCEPLECVVVEDAANGARAGIAAGMYTVMIPHYLPIPEDITGRLWHEGKSLAELSALIEAQNRKPS